MMVGPQIMSAVIFVTTPSAVHVSLGFLGGVAVVATAAGVALAWGLAAAPGNAVDLGSRDDNGSGGKIIQYVLVGLLAASTAKNWFGRATAEPPKRLGTLMTVSPKRAFKVGLLVILLMPSDIAIMLTAGVHLEQSDSGYERALPFIALTVLVAAIPLLARLLFHRRAESAAPTVQEWIRPMAGFINIIACAIFIVLILT